jgi:hypothetical protein
MADWENDNAAPSMVPKVMEETCHARADEELIQELQGASHNERAERLLTFITHDPLRLMYLLYHSGYLAAFFRWCAFFIPGIILVFLSVTALRTVTAIWTDGKQRHAAMTRDVEALASSVAELKAMLKSARVEEPSSPSSSPSPSSPSTTITLQRPANSSFGVGDKVLVRDQPDGEGEEESAWERGTVTGFDAVSGAPKVAKMGWEEAFEWDEVKKCDKDDDNDDDDDDDDDKDKEEDEGEGAD